MDDKILDIMRKVFKVENINYLSSQMNCEKWDSIHHLDLIVELESGFGIEFEPEEIADMKTFEKVKSIIESKV